jgi:Leucine Rich repeat
MAIVSKAVFEKAAGKAPSLGQRLHLDRYVSANRGLTALSGGGRLFLVTVRPPDEALWLVAVLENPTFVGDAWVAAPCDTPLTDVSADKGQLVFESGKGLPTAPGTLGMSLQTPRVLTAGDVARLLAALSSSSSSSSPSPSSSSLSSSPSSSSPSPPSRPAPAIEDPELALRAAVLAAPTSDAPKLALGAHWRAAGEVRGELVEVDLALRGRLAMARRRALRERRDELLAAHAKRWWPWQLTSVRQRAGFAVAVSAPAAQLLKVAPQLFAAEPVLELEVTDVDEDVLPALAKAPWLARLSALTVRGPIGDEGFAVLVKSKHTAGLSALNVSVNELSAEGIAALDKGLPALQRLVLTGNAIGDEGAAALAAWKHVEHLRTLYLSACELSAAGVEALLASGRLAGLEKLTLADNELGDEGAAALARHAGQLSHLRYLEVRAASIRDQGAAALASARFPHLRHLDFRGNWSAGEALRAAYRAALIV